MSEAYVDENIECKPKPGPNFNTSANISPQEGFLLSQADGSLSIQEILQILPFPKAEVGTMLINLRRSGVLTWEGGTEPPHVEAEPEDEPESETGNESAEAPTQASDSGNNLLDDDFDDMDFSGDDVTVEEPEPIEAEPLDDADMDFGFEPSANSPATQTAPAEPVPDEKSDHDAGLLDDDFDQEIASQLDEVQPATETDQDEEIQAADDIDDMLNELGDLSQSEATEETAEDNIATDDDPDELMKELEALDDETFSNMDSLVDSIVEREFSDDSNPSAADSNDEIEDIDNLLEEAEASWVSQQQSGSQDDINEIEPESVDDKAHPDVEDDDKIAAEDIGEDDFDDIDEIMADITDDDTIDELPEPQIGEEKPPNDDDTKSEEVEEDDSAEDSPDELLQELGALDDDFEGVIADLEQSIDSSDNSEVEETDREAELSDTDEETEPATEDLNIADLEAQLDELEGDADDQDSGQADDAADLELDDLELEQSEHESDAEEAQGTAVLDFSDLTLDDVEADDRSSEADSTELDNASEIETADENDVDADDADDADDSDEIDDEHASEPDPEPVRAVRKSNPKSPSSGSHKDSPDLDNLRKRLSIQQRILEKDDPFEALGVKGGSSDKQIRDAWHRLSKIFHPDRYFDLDLPDDLAADLNEVFGELQEAYELIGTREARRAFMFGQRDSRVSKSREKRKAQKHAVASDAEKAAENTADSDRIAHLAEEALARGQYKSAVTNFKMAAQMSKKKEYAERAKLVELLERVEGRIDDLQNSDELPHEDDVKNLKNTIEKIESVLPESAGLLKGVTEFLFENTDDFDLTRRILERLLKLNRLPATLILGAKIYMKNDLPGTALDLLDDAKQRDPASSEIKSLIKEAKRQKKK